MIRQKRTFLWEKDAEKVCALLRNTPTTLRIIIKTKDDETLIERWIQHYTRIVKRDTDIIIFDNMSTREHVLDVYQQYQNQITLVKYSNFFNDIHDSLLFPELYQAIWQSSKFYFFVDTDEFLYVYDGGRLTAGEAITNMLNTHEDAAFFTTFWLKNAYFRNDVFTFKRDKEYVRYLAAMGKPIVNSAVARKVVRRLVVHTLHLPLAMRGKSPCPFVLLHCKTLSKEQRISANMKKLVQHGFITHARDFHRVLTVTIDTVHRPILRYLLLEVRTLLAMPDSFTGAIEPGHLEVMGDGTLRFHPPEAQALFDAHVRTDASFFELMGPGSSGRLSADSLLWELYDKDSLDRDTPPQLRWEFS